ncbi:hypothetical protein ACFIOY_19915 [Bradyrhizobium sp. TZ2]
MKAGVWFRRGRLFMVSPDSRAYRARRRAETPLSVLFKFASPALSSTRHSVDIPRAHFRDSAQVPPQSNLRDDLFSSARYTLPSEEQPAIQTKNSKNSGLWSRIKSGVGKAFGTSRSEKPSGSTPQQEVVSTKFRVDYAKQPGRTRGVPEEDEELFEDFKSKAKVTRDDCTGKVLGDGTIKNAIADLRHLSGRLSQNGRPSIADRIGNPELEAGLDDDVETYAKDRSRRIKAAFRMISSWRSRLTTSCQDGAIAHAVIC